MSARGHGAPWLVVAACATTATAGAFAWWICTAGDSHMVESTDSDLFLVVWILVVMGPVWWRR